MKQAFFFLVGFILLLLAFGNQHLYVAFPEIFTPVYQFIEDIGVATLYVGGFLAVIIALFSGLKTWTSILLFLALASASSYYLHFTGKQISIDFQGKAISIVDSK
ncbi:hypothetical protein [Candidatus Parabeggiatoa sp. HSG14]|uniref:hypothetical protein n=1 Tax=Candidatus Parabeggiatoa sp. HSG14 TaxID=3055593 RepID=UPI0025A69446|nr:hypothetical protein [Thiotrichales bacterium HSG14]